MAAAVVSATAELDKIDAESARRGALAASAAWARYAPAADRLLERTRATAAERRRLIDSISDKALKASVE